MKNFTIISFIFGICIGVHGLVSLFCKNPYLDYLIAALGVAVLVWLLYRLEEKTRLLPNKCIKTPCPIVYRKRENDYSGSSLYCLPYLDLLRTDMVWGFEIAGAIKISKNESEPSGWEKAKINKSALCSNNFNVRLPDAIEMLIIGHNMQKIDKTVAILKENGVKADDFSFGKYWCVDAGLFGKVIPKVVYLRAGNWLKILSSRYKPKDLKQVFFVRFVAQY
jgi:hypothetical protein